MLKWRIDKSNKIPLYLQLKDLIKYYISTGIIKESQKLPGVNALGKELSVNFETVRKAYKELEKEGIISMERGRGTVVTLQGSPVSRDSRLDCEKSDPGEILKFILRRMIHSGHRPAQVKKIVDRMMEEILQEKSRHLVLFSECNAYQNREFSRILADYLEMQVIPVLIADLPEKVKKLEKEDHRILGIITTGFHINEVREMFRGQDLDILALITSMSAKTRLALLSLDKKSHLGFICRDRESIPFWEDLIRGELNWNIDLTCSILNDEHKVAEILNSVDVLLASPPVYPTLKKMVPEGLQVFNVFDRVDSMSMRLIKDRISENL